MDIAQANSKHSIHAFFSSMFSRWVMSLAVGSSPEMPMSICGGFGSHGRGF
jgi:hypothetical protein